MALSQIVAVAIAAAGAMVALWLLIKSARGQIRVLAIIGTVLVLLGVLARFALQWMSEWFLGEVDVDVIVPLLAADLVAGGVLTGVGLLLVARAIVVAGYPSWMNR